MSHILFYFLFELSSFAKLWDLVSSTEKGRDGLSDMETI